MAETRRKKRRSRYRLENALIPAPPSFFPVQTPSSSTPASGLHPTPLFQSTIDREMACACSNLTNSSQAVQAVSPRDLSPENGRNEEVLDFPPQNASSTRTIMDPSDNLRANQFFNNPLYDDAEDTCFDLPDGNAFSSPNIFDDEYERSDTPVVLKDFEDGLKISDWRVIWGLVVTNGSLKVTKNQYQTMRVLADTFRRLGEQGAVEKSQENGMVPLSRQRLQSLPHYSTLFKVYKPFLYRSLAVRGVQTLEKVSIRQAGAWATTLPENGDPLAPINLVLPSEYARADVACESVFNLMLSTALSSADTGGDCVDKWPLIRARSWFYGPHSYISVEESPGHVRHHHFAETGDTVSLDVMGNCDWKAEVRQNFFRPSIENSNSILTGKIRHIWTVHNSKRKDEDVFTDQLPHHLDSREKEIVAQLMFSFYQSHAGNNTETDLQDSSWEKPLLKPGDVVALLAPPSCVLDGNSDGAIAPAPATRLCLVQRFWIECEERSRHVFWIPADAAVISINGIQNPGLLCSTLDICGPALYRNVRRISLSSIPPGERGYDKFEPVSSHGLLASGERYFIYRFLLFWDGFEIKSGKSASGEGFYLICLNLPRKARSSPNAVRIISLTPPGIKGDVVFKNIQGDILKGMNERFLDYDANRERIRIFLDLVGFIGDTPAINSAIDVLGHTGGACCHLCTFRRCPSSLLGSRYTRRTQGGLSTTCGRRLYQHSAVRDSNAKSDDLRFLGMSSPDVVKPLPIHKLSTAMRLSMPLIPKSDRGAPILSGFLDPYRSCLIGPDHLLTGHFRDCINAAFKLLPSANHRKAVEFFMIGFLHECKLPTQNRLFDIEKRMLLSMSMTELYALSAVAHLAFIRACEYTATPEVGNLSEKCLAAIEIVGSCSSLISHLWNTELIPRGRTELSSYLSRAQSMTHAHIGSVENLYEMPDSDFQELQNPRASRSRKAELSKVHRECLIAIKALDKPNIHRLLELANSTLPMIGHVSRIGELVLEKRHQSLKRSIKTSNNKDVQIQSVQGAIFNDWQARLTMDISGALANKPTAIRGCFRLLAGRESLIPLSGQMTVEHGQSVQRAIGPGCCVPALLDSHGMSVISARASYSGHPQWLLERRIELFTGDTRMQSGIRSSVYQAFSRLCTPISGTPSLTFGDRIRSVYSNGMTELEASSGDLVRVQCFSNQAMSAHFPVVAQANLSTNRSASSTNKSPLFCRIAASFSRVIRAGQHEFWASVYPCAMIPSDYPSTELPKRPQYACLSTLCFLKWESTIRRVAQIPVCPDNSCTPSSTTGRINHSAICGPSFGTPFFVLSDSEGYPPRQG